MSDGREWHTWYDSLAKPGWTPAGTTIGTIWSVLYPIIIVVFGYSVYRVAKGTLPAYLTWVSTATVLQLSITWMNRRGKSGEYS